MVATIGLCLPSGNALSRQLTQKPISKLVVSGKDHKHITTHNTIIEWMLDDYLCLASGQIISLLPRFAFV
jgi:hypothetical protein